MRKFEVLLNVLSVAVLVALGWIGVRDHFALRVRAQAPDPLKIGTHLSIPGVAWTGHPRTLLMVLATDCRHCEASLGFYRGLLRGNSMAHRFFAVAVFPESTSIGQAYVHMAGLSVDAVRQASRDALPVIGTPTLLLVDASGRVERTWIGELNRQRELEVYASVGMEPPKTGTPQRDDPKDAELVSASRLRELLQSEPDITIVDARPRASYRQGHIAGAINIPSDEIYARAPIEINSRGALLVYCNYCFECENRSRQEGLLTLCSHADRDFHSAGFEDVRILRDSLEQMRAAGVNVVGDVREQAAVMSTPN